jgi:hypothetical protein
MTRRDIGNQLAGATDAIRNESRWLKEQAARVTENMDAAWPVMSAAWKRIRELEGALRDMTIATRAETPQAEKAFAEANRLLSEIT